MAISPNDIKLTKDEELDIARLEKRLDHALALAWDGKNAVPFAQSIFDCSDRARDNLFDKYRKLGWHICHVSDSRDGDYFSFSGKK